MDSSNTLFSPQEVQSAGPSDTLFSGTEIQGSTPTSADGSLFSNDEVTASGNANGTTQPDYLSKTEDFIDQAAKGAGSELWGMAKGLVSIPGLSDLASLPTDFRAYEQARSQGKSVFDSYSAAAKAYQQRNDVIDAVGSRLKEFKSNPGSATGKALIDLAPMLVSLGSSVGTAATAEDVAAEGSAADTAVTPKPGIVKQVIQGKNAAQPAAQTALRTAAGTDTPSLIDALKDRISGLDDEASTSYQEFDQAAGTDLKALRQKLGNTEYEMGQLTDTAADQAKATRLEKARQGLVDKIESAKQAATDAGVDTDLLDKADAKFTQARALQDVQTKVLPKSKCCEGFR
ncbi:MAG TPA: hypothetical protein VF753_16905 [Terriglobales bacterium]